MFNINGGVANYHHGVTKLRGSTVALSDGRTKIIASRSPATKCVVFVHGFDGDALATWAGFGAPGALNEKEFASTDLIFFGYDGLQSNALAASSFLFDLLDGLMSGSVRPSSSYTRCVIVAHSLGAVVSRWALLRAYDSGCDWIDKTRYLLFAPAHSGGVIVDGVLELLDGNAIMKALGAAAKIGMPLLRELASDSAMLKTLERKTRAAKGCNAVRPNRVVIAEYEDIVSNLPFPGDPYPTAMRDAHHTTVCKPAKYFDAVGFVTELLR